MNLDRILNEEIENEMKRLKLDKPEKVVKVLKELFSFSTDSFLKNIGSQEALLDEDEEVSQENWDWLMQTINESFKDNPKEWGMELKKQKLKILCYKYFTQKEMLKLEALEKDLKVNIKKYFTALQNFSDLANFREKFFNLPFDILNNFVRIILNKTESVNKITSVSKKELKKEIQQAVDDREKMVNKISLLSKKYQDTLDMTLLKKLYDYGVFFEDNFVNRGVNEYMVKMLNHKGAAEQLRDKFNTAVVNDLKFHAENSVAYLNHIDSIRNEEAEEYFTQNGFQLGTRFDNEIEIAANKTKQDNYIIDKESRLKEPSEKVETVPLPGETAPGMDGMDGGDEGQEGGGVLGPDGSPMPQDGAGVGLPGGGGLMAGGMPDIGGGEGGEEDGEGEMPTDEDGFPVDFGTPETNPEGAAENADEATPGDVEEQPEEQK